MLGGVGCAVAPLLRTASAVADVPLYLPPFPVPAPGRTAGKARAVPSTKPVFELKATSRYRKDDPTKSIVDPELSEAYEAAVAPLRVFTKTIIKASNRFVASNGQDIDAAAQVMAILKQWAAADSLKFVDNETGFFVRSSALGPAALAILQVRSALPAGWSDTVGNWLVPRAAETLQFYSGSKSMSSRNNHRYITGLHVLATGIACNVSDFYTWGVDCGRIGTSQIQADGSLPLEVNRAKRALAYHAFALGPLMMIAEAAARNGDMSLYNDNDGGIHRLVDFTLSQIDDPTLIEKMTGVTQERLGQNGAAVDNNSLAWLEIYESRFPGRSRWTRRMADLRPLAATTLGGNLTLLYAGLRDSKGGGSGNGKKR